jgi:type IV secretory pathway TrbD component
MLLLIALLVVLVVAGLGFALHVLWIAALVLLALWLVGVVVGRGEHAGDRHFYRW